MLDDTASIQAVLSETFGLTLPVSVVTEALVVLDRKGTRGTTHPAFK